MDDGILGETFLESIRFRFRALKDLGDRALEQVSEGDYNRFLDDESNSIAIMIQHLHGNMISRWTNFLTADGEKESRDRDSEFVTHPGTGRKERLKLWEEGWSCLFSAIDSLEPADLLKEVAIRGQSLNVIDAIHRQLSHYAHHVGQLVMLAKHFRSGDWRTLSVERGASKSYRPNKRD